MFKNSSSMIDDEIFVYEFECKEPLGCRAEIEKRNMPKVLKNRIRNVDN